MENKNWGLYFTTIFTLIMFSCTENKNTILETPFVVVVKLVSAEQDLYFDEAKKYIDIVQVYKKIGSKNPEEDWKKLIKFQYNIGKDKKISNNFGYYQYDIEETILENKAKVCFKRKKDNKKSSEIIYGLERRQNKWIVISIDYSK